MADTLKTLGTLVKMAEQKLEEKQQQITHLEGEIAKIDAQVAELDRSVSEGYQKAQAAGDSMLYEQATGYAHRAEAKKEELDMSKQALVMLQEQCREELREQFLEKKRYQELHKTERLKREAKRNKKAQAALDDVAALRHRRDE